MLVWAETVSEEVVTVTASPVEVAAGLETALAVTSTVAPPSMVPHPELTFKATVAPPLLVAALYSPHCPPVVTSWIVYVVSEVNSVPAGAARVMVE